MKKIISNRLNMYGSVLSTLNTNQTAWNSVPVFAEAVGQFTQKLSDLNAEITRAESLTDGVKSSRDAKLNEVRVLVTRFVKAFQVLGLVTDNAAVKDRYHFSVSGVANMNSVKLQVLLGKLMDDVIGYGQELSNYGITQEDRDRLTTMNTEIFGLHGKVRTAIVDRSVAVGHIDELDHELQVLLHDHLDKLMVVIAEEFPAFFTAYRKARHIIEHGHPKDPEGSQDSTSDGLAA